MSKFKFRINPWLSQPTFEPPVPVDNDDNKHPNFPTKVISIWDFIDIFITPKDVYL